MLTRDRRATPSFLHPATSCLVTLFTVGVRRSRPRGRNLRGRPPPRSARRPPTSTFGMSLGTPAVDPRVELLHDLGRRTVTTFSAYRLLVGLCDASLSAGAATVCLCLVDVSGIRGRRVHPRSAPRRGIWSAESGKLVSIGCVLVGSQGHRRLGRVVRPRRPTGRITRRQPPRTGKRSHGATSGSNRNGSDARTGIRGRGRGRTSGERGHYNECVTRFGRLVARSCTRPSRPASPTASASSRPTTSFAPRSGRPVRLTNHGASSTPPRARPDKVPGPLCPSSQSPAFVLAVGSLALGPTPRTI